MPTKKHAYLIIAHNEFNMLKLLIRSLDDERNDIYVMVDAKSEDFNQKEFEGIAKYSDLIFTKRIKNYWAAFTHIEAHILLMEEALKNKYEYYHIISGVDIPLKTQNEIHSFFENSQSKEFVSMNEKSMNELYEQERMKKITKRDKIRYLLEINQFKFAFYYYFNQKCLNGSNYCKFAYRLARIVFVFQQLLGIQRNKKIKIYKGSDWFSITHNLLIKILNKEEWVKKHFNYCFCPSELYVQTITKNFGFENNIYEGGNMRYIDWKRGCPYTFLSQDYDELINSGKLFSRKFSTAIDKEIIRKLYCRLLPEDVVNAELQ